MEVRELLATCMRINLITTATKPWRSGRAGYRHTAGPGRAAMSGG
jgi:hypothetical protein